MSFSLSAASLARWRWALLALAAAVRVSAWLERVGRGSFDGMLDTRVYRQVAAALLEQGWVPPQAFFMSPLYPYLVAVGGAKDGGAAPWILLPQIALGLFALWVLGRATGRWAGPVAELGVLALGALAAPLALYDTSLLPDGPATACAALAMGWILGREDGRLRPLVAAGLACAVGIWLRSNFLLLALGLLVGLVWSRRRSPWRPALAFAAPVLVAMAGLAAVNHAAEGLWAPRSYNGGLNLFIGNNPQSEGTYTTVNQIHPGDPAGRAAAEQARGRRLNSAEVDAFWREQAMDFARENPAREAYLVGRRLLLFLHPLELPQMEDLMLSRRESWALYLARVGFGALVAFAVLGFWRGPRELRTRGWPLLVGLGCAAFVALVFFVNGRLRMPAWPALLPFAGAGVAVLFEASRARNLRPLVGPLVLVLALRIAVGFVDVHPTFTHARSAARYAALEALEGRRAYAQQWIGVMEELKATGSPFGDEPAIERTFREKPDSEWLLRTERAAALYAMGDLRGAFEELDAVTTARPGFLRAQRGLLDVSEQLLRSGVQDPRVRAARDAARRRLQASSTPPGGRADRQGG